MLGTPSIFMTFKMRYHTIRVHLNSLDQTPSNPNLKEGVGGETPTKSKSILDYTNYMCQIAFDNSEALRWVGWISMEHPVY